MKAEVC